MIAPFCEPDWQIYHFEPLKRREATRTSSGGQSALPNAKAFGDS